MLENHMNESKVYEISYLLVPSIPAEKVGAEVERLSGILANNSAEIIADEAPSLIPLAYQMDKSTGAGSYEHYQEGYFGWIKFSCPSSSIEAVQKAFEAVPVMLRTLAVSTIREKTYLGKRAKSDARFDQKTESRLEEKPTERRLEASAEKDAIITPMTPNEIAAVDKSIDEMVKGA
jgi:ribosomal protein S6